MTDIIKTLEQDVVVVWDDFQKGVIWLETEASNIGKWLQKVDPAIAAQFQTLITDGEAAAATLAQYSGQAISGLIAGAVPEIESTIASLVSNTLGVSPAAVTANKGAAQIVADIGDISQSVVKVALVKVLSGLAYAATAAGV